MTTTTKPGKTGQKHNDWAHGPVAAAFNLSAVPLAVTTVAKLFGWIPPWIPLVCAVVMAGCLVWAGRNRQPRPLSRVSLIYRAAVAAAIGGWMWWQLATFPHVGLTAGQTAGLLAAPPAAVVLLLVASARSRIPALFRFLPGAAAAVFAAGLAMVLRQPVLAWLDAAFTVVDRLPHTKEAVLPWLGGAALQAVAVAAPAAVLGVAFASRERTADEQLAAAERFADRGVPARAKAIQKLFCDLAGETTIIRSKIEGEPDRIRRHLVVTDVKPWGNDAGETYIFNLTGSTKHTTMEGLRRHADDAATKLNLPKGCGVEVAAAEGVDRNGDEYGRGYAAVDVSRKNVLKEKIDYPALRPRSILNPMPLGQIRSGMEIGPYFRENSAFLWGQKGSGKTVCIYCIIAGALQCTDTLVWVIDLNNGAAARPFLRGWHEGKVGRPGIDWVASTIDEVKRMAEVGERIAVDRKNFYADLKFQHNTNLMPIGNGTPGNPPPEVLIIIDEGAEVMGVGGSATDAGREARAAMNAIMRLARDAAINIVFSGLRATSDVADTDFSNQTSIRIGMQVTDDRELAYGFGDYSLSAREIPYKGSGFIRVGNDQPDVKVFKSFFLDPQRCYEIGMETTQWRPYLDARGQLVAGSVYANRWRRTAPQIWKDPRPEMVNYGTTPGGSAAAAAGGGADTGPAGGGGGTATAVMDRPADMPNVPDRTGRTDTGVMVPQAGSFDEIMEQARRMRKQDDGDGDDGQPPAGDLPPAGGEGQPEPAPRSEPAADLDQDAVNKKFAALVQQPVLDWEPEYPARYSEITPDEEIGGAHPKSREILENLVLTKGPLKLKQIHKMLTSGGDWGPAVLNEHGDPISVQALHKLLKQPGQGNKPAAWLAERQQRDPYDHKNRGK